MVLHQTPVWYNLHTVYTPSKYNRPCHVAGKMAELVMACDSSVIAYTACSGFSWGNPAWVRIPLLSSFLPLLYATNNAL